MIFIYFILYNIYVFIYMCVCVFIYLFIYIFIYLFIYLYTNILYLDVWSIPHSVASLEPGTCQGFDVEALAPGPLTSDRLCRLRVMNGSNAVPKSKSLEHHVNYVHSCVKPKYKPSPHNHGPNGTCRCMFGYALINIWLLYIYIYTYNISYNMICKFPSPICGWLFPIYLPGGKTPKPGWSAGSSANIKRESHGFFFHICVRLP